MFAMPPAPPVQMSATAPAPESRAAAGEEPPVPAPVQTTAPTAELPPFGPDVSVWQGFVSWPTVVTPPDRAGGVGRAVSFAFTKANQGRWVDPTLAANWQGMLDAGLIRGVYDFGDFSRKPVAEARSYVAAVKAVGGFRAKGDFAVLDAEGPTTLRKAKVVRWIRSWTRAVGRLTNLPNSRIVIYTGSWWWGPHTGNSTAFARAGHLLWLSGYGKQPSLPGWQWSWWQYTDRAKVPGIRGGSDASIWHGDMASLRKAAGF